ncbi:MAG: hypothetical protein ACRENO_09405 [Thermodesulfobacteriota bacterium]
MAEVTLNIPDPILAKIDTRAKQTNNTRDGIIIANLGLVFGAAIYDDSKWLKNLQDEPDKTKPW